MSQNAVIFLLLCALVAMIALSSLKRSAEQGRVETLAAVELDAAEAAIQVLARADRLQFDARAARTPVDLTPLPFAGGQTFSAARDLDDLHEMEPVEYAAADGTSFRATAAVDYVAPGGASATQPTDRKRVTVTVTHPALPAPVELGRVYEMPTP